MSEVLKDLQNILGWFTGAPYARDTIKRAISLIENQDNEIRRLKELYEDDGK